MKMDIPLDKSWMSMDRRLHEYDEGVEQFLNFALLNANDHNSLRCPCVRCVNCECLPLEEVRDHLFVHGIDQRYRAWYWHGEELPSVTTYPQTTGYSPFFESHPPEDGADAVDMVKAAQEQCPDDPHVFKQLLEDAEKPLYPGCSKFTKLSAVARLYRLKTSNGHSDKSFTELLKLLATMLPDNNEMPTSIYEAKKTLKSLGLNYEKIHACPNDCILYRKEFVDASECPQCHTSRWKDGKVPIHKRDGVPSKVLWYFPPIPRFRRMFQTADIARNLIWHSKERKVDDQLRHPADSASWKLVNLKWPKFGMDPRNLRLALSADGFNPHSSYNTPYSCWPVILITYNLPPWLCMKRKFMMLTLLISGPKQPGNDIDVYLAPLLDDLKLLWNVGVEVYDAYEKQIFTLKAVLLWTINDFPAYGNLSGCCVKGYKACPICGENTYSIRLKRGRKNAYLGHQRFLPDGHEYRKRKWGLCGKHNLGKRPVILTGVQTLQQVERINYVWGDKKKKRKDKDNEGTKCWNKKSSFFELEYWKHLHVRHNLDVMHIEKNVCDSIIGTLLNIPNKTKDGENARLDWVELAKKKELKPEKRGERIYLPPTSYTLSKEEKKLVCKTLFEVKVPDGFSSNIRNLVSMQDLKIQGMKSHDCHVFMQQLLSVAIRNVLPKNVRYAIARFCLFFKNICSKAVDVTLLPVIQKQVVLTLCALEKIFPPSFFDIMIHLTVHLVREVQLCGPVQFRWMYPFERYMKVLKGYVRNRTHPEGCIAECYIAEEAVEFCTEYFSDLDSVGVTGSRNLDEEFYTGRPITSGKVVKVNKIEWEQAHRYVLENTDVIQPYIMEHIEYLKKLHPQKVKMAKWIQEEHHRTFIGWIHKKIDDLLSHGDKVDRDLEWIANGPSDEVFKVPGYIIKGCRYYTKERDGMRANQNSGVSLVATAMHVASARDNNPVVAETTYYGVINEIWLLNYHMFKIPIFKCDWVDSNNGIKVDDLGFTLVQLDRIGHKNEPFVLASQAKQVFYIQDQLELSWYVVLAAPQRDYLDEELEEEVNDVCVDRIDIGQALPDDEYIEGIDQIESMLLRDGVEGEWVDA